jgi:hypothetical protein
MKIKKLLAALAASALALSMVGMTAFAAPVGGDEEEPAGLTPEPEVPAPIPEEPTPVAPPVTNPATGNPAVALAVIPVALAAAAVVARKAKK